MRSISLETILRPKRTEMSKDSQSNETLETRDSLSSFEQLKGKRIEKERHSFTSKGSHNVQSLLGSLK